jgi:hypothetical protein
MPHHHATPDPATSNRIFRQQLDLTYKFGAKFNPGGSDLSVSCAKQLHIRQSTVGSEKASPRAEAVDLKDHHRSGDLSCYSLDSITRVIFGADSFSFGLYCWPPGEAAVAEGGMLARRVAAVVGGVLAQHVAVAVGGTLARRVEPAVGGAQARRVAVREEPGVLRGPPVALRAVSEPATGSEVFARLGAQKYAGPAGAAF